MIKPEAFLRLLGDLAGALWAGTFGHAPLMWTFVCIALFFVVLAGWCFADARGWLGMLWLLVAVALFALACALPVPQAESWEEPQARPGALGQAQPSP